MAVVEFNSETDYQNLTQKTGNLFKAICYQRSQLFVGLDELANDDEIGQWRERSQGRSFSWDDSSIFWIPTLCPILLNGQQRDFSFSGSQLSIDGFNGI